MFSAYHIYFIPFHYFGVLPKIKPQFSISLYLRECRFITYIEIVCFITIVAALEIIQSGLVVVDIAAIAQGIEKCNA